MSSAHGTDLPAGNGPRCTHCTHPIAWHDEDGCRHGRGTLFGGCACTTVKARRKHANGASSSTTTSPATSPAALLLEAAAAAHAFAHAFNRFANAAIQWTPSTPAAAPAAMPAAPTKKEAAPLPVTAHKTTAAASLEALGLPGKARELLEIIAREAGAKNTRVAFGFLFLATGYSARTLTTYTAALRSAGFLGPNKRELEITPKGLAEIGPAPRAPMSGEALAEVVSPMLPLGPRAIFRLALAAYPDALTFDTIRGSTNYADRSITTYVGELVRRKAVTRQGRAGIRASDRFFQKDA